jgi:hypothetical protein
MAIGWRCVPSPEHRSQSALITHALPNAMLCTGKEVQVPTAEIFVGNTIVIWTGTLPGLIRTDD